MKSKNKMFRMLLGGGMILLFMFMFVGPAAAQICVDPPAGLVSWWDADAVSGTTAVDIQGGNDGTMVGGVGIVPGMVGNAFSFDGVDDYTEVIAPFGGGAELTIEAWIKTTGTTLDFQAIVSSLVPGQFVHLQLAHPDPFPGNIAVYTTEFLPLGMLLDPIPQTPIDVWRHVALSIKSGDTRLYVDGVLFDIHSGLFSVIEPTSTIRIGGGCCSPTPGRFFKGLIDEIQIYNRALTAEEIEAIFIAGSAGKCKPAPVCVAPPLGLVSWWDADSVSGNTAFDIQDGNDGTLVNGATTAPGFVGNAFSFDGVDDFISVPDSTNQQTPSITIEGWFNVTTAPGPCFNPSGLCVLASKYQPPGIFVGWILAIDTLIRPLFGVARPPNLGGEAGQTVAIPLNTWTHIAGTYDGATGAVSLYINGILVDNGILVGGYQPASTPMKIGAATWFSGGFMNGLADEVELYDRALTANEIADIFNAGNAGKCKALEFVWDAKFCSNPNSFNCKRTRGVVPVTIFGSAELDVSQIDISSLRLALDSDPAMTTGAPISSKPPEDRGSPGDVDATDTDCNEFDVANPEGFDDLDVGFDAAEVGDLIGCAGLSKGDNSPDLIITGTLLDGTPLEAINVQVLTNVSY